ncbi:hypothetical protein MGSAQ_000697 [marine sediment metagenome]|uniref:Uncharacterized protein n=1 Tax=marine sediment metagenome TaxID=412755 RepID=A0A1B6NWS7_9ZZZZ
MAQRPLLVYVWITSPKPRRHVLSQIMTIPIKASLRVMQEVVIIIRQCVAV